MLNFNKIREIFIGRFNIEDIKLVKKDKEYLENFKDYKKLPLNKNFILAVKGNIALEKLIVLRDFIEEILEKDKIIKSLKRKVEIFEEEFKTLSNIEQLIIASEFEREILEKFFSTLYKNKYNYVFVVNDNIIINTGVDKNFLKYVLGKLRKTEKLSFRYLNGEVFAIKNNILIFILLSLDSEIESFYKELIEVKLLLLKNIFVYLGKYFVDELTGFFTKKKLSIDLKIKKNKIGLIINIKNFNYINNVFGISFGDKVLKEFGAVIKELNKKNKDIYRITGDKFLILFKNSNEAIKFFRNLENILQKGLNIFHDSTQEFVSLTLNIQGVLLKNISEQFIDNAIVYLKKDHFNGKSIIFFEEEIYPLLQRDLESLKIVQEAISKESVFPAFQKIVSLKEEDYYFEALMRIKLNDKVYNPGQFLEISKEKGLYPKLSNILLKKSVTAIKHLKTKVSINVEISDILRKDFFKKIEFLLEKLNIPREYIVFEITENEYMGNYFNEVKKSIFTLKDKGFLIAIDDFGSGYSNFQSLTEIPIDIIKIDGSLIKDITSNTKLKYIVSSIVSMARLLDIKTVAEFVSNEEIYKEVLKLDVDYAQGFYVSKPQFLEEIVNLENENDKVEDY